MRDEFLKLIRELEEGRCQIRHCRSQQLTLKLVPHYCKY